MQYAAGILGLIAGLFYVYAIITGTAKPNRVTWIIWFTIGIIFNLSYFEAGARENMFLSLAGQVNAGIILILSIKYGMHKIVPTDIVCLMLAAMVTSVYIVSGDASSVVLMLLIVNFIGFIPTYVKVWRYPKTEPVLPWLLGIVAGLLILPVTDYSLPSVYIQPMYEILTKVALLSIMAFRAHVALRNKKLIRLSVKI